MYVHAWTEAGTRLAVRSVVSGFHVVMVPGLDGVASQVGRMVVELNLCGLSKFSDRAVEWITAGQTNLVFNHLEIFESR